jgi:hypothetical protein
LAGKNNAKFLAKNWRKSPKKVIITLAPDHLLLLQDIQLFLLDIGEGQLACLGSI